MRSQRSKWPRQSPRPMRIAELEEAPSMTLVVTARPTAGDIILGLDRKTDIVQMDTDSALKVAHALLDAVMALEDDPEATRQ